MRVGGGSVCWGVSSTLRTPPRSPRDAGENTLGSCLFVLLGLFVLTSVLAEVFDSYIQEQRQQASQEEIPKTMTMGFLPLLLSS